MTENSFSPEQLANIVGVSQSSIKRWVDAGKISVTRTAGGHRRISRSAALTFIRKNKMRIERPDLLGIADLEGSNLPIDGASLSGEFLHGLFVSGNNALVRKAVTSAFMAGMTTHQLFDGPLREALQSVGSIWKTDQKGIYIEHSATIAVTETISQLAALLGEPDADAPLAIGAAPSNDPHIIPNMMVSTVLLEAGWRTMNLGPNTPAHALRDAVSINRPEMVWIAVKSKMTRPTLEDLYSLCSELEADGITVVAGGAEVERTRKDWPSSVRLARTMSDLTEAASDIAGK